MKYVDSNKYDKEIVRKYILGGEIKDFDIDELEEDYEFMLQVLNETKDKNMLNLCSKEMLENPKFILGLIRIFNNDLEFVFKISQNIIEDTEVPTIAVDEIMVETYECLNRDEEFIEDNYAVGLTNIICKMFINSVISESLVCAEEDGHGIGFSHIQYKFMESEFLQEYFAKELIDAAYLFKSYEKFERELHKNYQSSKSITDRGINTFVIEYIRMHDIELGEFVSTRLDLIKGKIKMIQCMVNNWDEYEKEKLEGIDTYITNSLFNGPYQGMINYIELMTYLNQEMDNQEIRKLYAKVSAYSISDDEYDDGIQQTVDSMKHGDFELRKWLTELKEHIGYMLRNGEIDTYTINNDLIDEKNERKLFIEEEPQTQKIIRFNPNNNEE